jgi:hypothetical protein
MPDPWKSGIFAELRAEVGEPLAVAAFIDQGDGPYVQVFDVDVPPALGGPKRIAVGKGMGEMRRGAAPDSVELRLSTVCEMVRERLETLRGGGAVRIASINDRALTRDILAASLLDCPAGGTLLCITHDERISGQLSWLLGIHLGEHPAGTPFHREHGHG